MIATDFDYAALATETLESCNLCGGSDFTEIATRDRAGFPARAVMCERCSLCFLNPRMPADAYDAFYRDGTYRRIVAGLRGVESYEEEMLIGQMGYAKSLLGFLGDPLYRHRGGSLLDIGGSTGVVAEALCARYGLRGTVVDPSASEVSEAAQRGLEVVAEPVESWDSDQRFDVIGIFQSIDHFLDIAGTLRKVHNLLADDGTFIVDIVEFRTLCIMAGVTQAVKIDHAFSLTAWTIEAYLVRAGFKIKRRGVTSPDARKIFYVCQKSEPRDVLPDGEALVEMREIVSKCR